MGILWCNIVFIGVLVIVSYLPKRAMLKQLVQCSLSLGNTSEARDPLA